MFYLTLKTEVLYLPYVGVHPLFYHMQERGTLVVVQHAGKGTSSRVDGAFGSKPRQTLQRSEGDPLMNLTGIPKRRCKLQGVKVAVAQGRKETLHEK